MTHLRELQRLGEDEEELEAVCATLASLLHEGDELRALSLEHRRSAALLIGERPRMKILLASMRAALTALVRHEERALAWLRDREHALVRAYLQLDCHQDIDDESRDLVRRVLLPAAFDRFTRIDRALAVRATEPVAVV